MHLSQPHLAPDRRPAAFRTCTDALCPAKGGLPVAGRGREELPGARVFLATTSCRLPLNGLHRVRKRLLGTARGPVSRALWGRICNRMAVEAAPECAWLPQLYWGNQLPVGTGSVEGGGKEQRGGDVYIQVTPFIQWDLEWPCVQRC